MSDTDSREVWMAFLKRQKSSVVKLKDHSLVTSYVIYKLKAVIKNRMMRKVLEYRQPAIKLWLLCFVLEEVITFFT